MDYNLETMKVHRDFLREEISRKSKERDTIAIEMQMLWSELREVEHDMQQVRVNRYEQRKRNTGWKK